MPVGEKFIRIERSIVEKLAESTSEFLLFWVLVDEEENNCLEEAFGSELTVFLHELEEGFLIGRPMLDDISFRVETTADEDVILVVRCDVENKLGLANFF